MLAPPELGFETPPPRARPPPPTASPRSVNPAARMPKVFSGSDRGSYAVSCLADRLGVVRGLGRGRRCRRLIAGVAGAERLGLAAGSSRSVAGASVADASAAARPRRGRRGDGGGRPRRRAAAGGGGRRAAAAVRRVGVGGLARRRADRVRHGLRRRVAEVVAGVHGEREGSGRAGVDRGARRHRSLAARDGRAVLRVLARVDREHGLPGLVAARRRRARRSRSPELPSPWAAG